jgi:hypothetical protein
MGLALAVFIPWDVCPSACCSGAPLIAIAARDSRVASKSSATDLRISSRRAALSWQRFSMFRFGDPVQVVGTEVLARCLRHETDHLDGVLFIDRMDAATRKLAMRNSEHQSGCR